MDITEMTVEEAAQALIVGNVIEGVRIMVEISK